MKKLLLLLSLLAFKANAGDEVNKIALDACKQALSLMEQGISPQNAMSIADTIASVKLANLTKGSAQVISGVPLWGMGVIGAGIIGYAGYRYVRTQSTVDLIVDNTNTVIGVSVTPASIESAVRRHNNNNVNDQLTIRDTNSIRADALANRISRENEI